MLRFAAFGFPVSVAPFFWVMAVLLGLNAGSPLALAIWVGVVFVSVLVHELGHALACRGLGMGAHIELYQMGGLTHPQGGRRLTHEQSIGLSLAGPAAGLALWALCVVVDNALDPIYTELPLGLAIGIGTALAYLQYVNLIWSLFNLLPVLPLDGGHVMESLVRRFGGPGSRALPLQISFYVAVGAAILLFLNQHIFAAAMLGWMAYDSYTALNSRMGPHRWG